MQGGDCQAAVIRMIPFLVILGLVVHPGRAEEAEPDTAPSLLNQRSIMQSWREVLSDYPVLQRAPKVQPGPDEKLEVLATSDMAYQHLKAGGYDDALRSFNKALALDPESKIALFGRGTVYLKLGREQEAVDDLEKIQAMYPKEYAIKNNLSFVYATSQDPAIRNPDRALELAQEALLMVPESYHVWHTVSAAHFSAGRYDKSLRAAQEALRLARTFRVPPPQLVEYEQQLTKCREAAGVFSAFN